MSIPIRVLPQRATNKGDSVGKQSHISVSRSNSTQKTTPDNLLTLTSNTSTENAPADTIARSKSGDRATSRIPRGYASKITPTTAIRSQTNTTDKSTSSSARLASASSTTSQKSSQSQDDSRSAPRRHAQARTDSSKGSVLPKKSFTTYQQHYSPVKASSQQQIQNTSARTISVADHKNPQLDFLRAELLQLALVHYSSCSNANQYRASVRERIAAEQLDLAAERTKVLQAEQEAATLQNHIAIQHWIQLTDEYHAGRALQELSLTIAEIDKIECELCADDGLSSSFEKWHDFMSRPDWQEQDVHLTDHTSTIQMFISNLEPNADRLKSRLQKHICDLTAIPEAMPGSALATIIAGYSTLARQMYDECCMIAEIGQSLLDRFENWLQDEIELSLADQRTNTPGIAIDAAWV